MKILSVVGARPQFIKAAPVTRRLLETPRIHEVMVHTGQHFDDDMSDIFFRELEIPPPAHTLGIHGGGHGRMTGRMLEALESVMQRESPAMVIVYGDTNTTLAGALAAAKLRVPVAHVEAGLRSFNRDMPEEINRVVSDHLSTLLLCPTRAAVKNLRCEGISSGVHQTGDVMYDAARHAAARARTRSNVIERLGLSDGTYAVATVHRAENTDDPVRLARVIDYLCGEAKRQTVAFPLHPRTRRAMERFDIVPHRLQCCPPVGYLDMIRLVSGATTVYTDSGGLQKEAYFHRIPCVTLREETEWLETIECGWNRFWTVPQYRPRTDISDYGNGQAAREVVSLIVDAVSPRP